MPRAEQMKSDYCKSQGTNSQEKKIVEPQEKTAW